MLSIKAAAIFSCLLLGAGCTQTMRGVVASGDVDAIQKLAESDPSSVNRYYAGKTPLQAAVDFRKVAAIRALLDADADVTLTPAPTPLDDAKRYLSYCDPSWYEPRREAVKNWKAGSEMRSIYHFETELYADPKTKADYQQIVAMLEEAMLTVKGPDGRRYPVITRLAPMQYAGAGPSYQLARSNPTPAITIAAGPNGPMYTVRQGDKIVARNTTIEQLQASHPDLYNNLKNRFAGDREFTAELSASRHFTLSPRPVPAIAPNAAEGPALDRFQDAREHE